MFDVNVRIPPAGQAEIHTTLVAATATLEEGLANGLNEGLRKASDTVARALGHELTAALTDAVEPLSHGLATGLAAGIDPTLQVLRQELRTTRRLVVGLGVAAAGIMALRGIAARRDPTRAVPSPHFFARTPAPRPARRLFARAS